MGNLFCFKPSREVVDVVYGDYIFDHSQFLKINVSKLLTDNLKIGDYIYLKVVLDDIVVYHTCLVHYKTPGILYISFLHPTIDFSEIKYIKKL